MTSVQYGRWTEAFCLALWSPHLDGDILVVIRPMSHGDFLLPDAPAELAVSELDGAKCLPGRLFPEKVRHMAQEPGGAGPHRRWGRGVMVTGRQDRRSIADGRRNNLRGHRRGVVDVVACSQGV